MDIFNKKDQKLNGNKRSFGNHFKTEHWMNNSLSKWIQVKIV